jgi:hypothetical protein
MLLHAQHGWRGRVYDLDERRWVPKVIWLDTDSGVLEAYEVNHRGEYCRDLNGNYLTYRARGRFVPTLPNGRPLPGHTLPDHALPDKTCSPTDPPIFPPERSGGVGDNGAGRVSKIVMGAPRCARCPSVLTLPGDDLCPTCRAAQRTQRNPMKVERILNPLLDRKCERCGRLAAWSVSDEVVVTPEPGESRIKGRTRKVLYDRGMTVGRRYYCSHHYRPPQLLDAKGEVVQEYDNDRVRPT